MNITEMKAAIDNHYAKMITSNAGGYQHRFHARKLAEVKQALKERTQALRERVQAETVMINETMKEGF